MLAIIRAGSLCLALRLAPIFCEHFNISRVRTLNGKVTRIEMTHKPKLSEVGIQLIVQSGLVKWDPAANRFTAPPVNPYPEPTNEKPFDRLQSWIILSVGIEYLLKAVCNNAGLSEPKSKPSNVRYPKIDEIADWASHEWERGFHEFEADGVPYSPFYDTLGYFVKYRVKELALKRSLSTETRELLFAGLKLLTYIRNRDVHTYEFDVRGENFELVSPVFVPILNTLWQGLLQSEKEIIGQSLDE